MQIFLLHRATVVRSTRTFWINLDSDIIHHAGNGNVSSTATGDNKVCLDPQIDKPRISKELGSSKLNEK